MTEQLTVLPDPDGLPHPYAFTTAENNALGPGEHVLTADLAMDPTGRYLAHTLVGADIVRPDAGIGTPHDPTSELHLYVRDGDQWTHTFAQGGRLAGYEYGGVKVAVRWSPDSNWLIIAAAGDFPASFYQRNMTLEQLSQALDDPVNLAYFERSKRLQVWRRDGEGLTLHGYGPDTVVLDTQYSGTYGLSLDFDASGQWLAMCGYYGFTGLLAFDTTTGALTVASGRTVPVQSYRMSTEEQLRIIADVTANSALWQAWNPTDATQLLRIDIGGRCTIRRRVGPNLVLERDFLPDTTCLFPSWHRSGTCIAVVEQGLCGQLVPVLHAFPSGEVLGGLARGGYLISAYYGSAAVRFDPTGQYLSTGAVAVINGEQNDYVLQSTRVVAFTAGGHPVPGTGGPTGIYGTINPDDYSGLVPLDLPPIGHRTGGLVVWGQDPAGGNLYLASVTEDFGLLNTVQNRYIPVDWASPWGFRLYRMGPGGPRVVSILAMRDTTGQISPVGTTARPLSMVMPDGSQRTWPDTSAPLYQKQPDGTWRLVIGEGAQ